MCATGIQLQGSWTMTFLNSDNQINFSANLYKIIEVEVCKRKNSISYFFSIFLRILSPSPLELSLCMRNECNGLSGQEKLENQYLLCLIQSRVKIRTCSLQILAFTQYTRPASKTTCQGSSTS